MQPLKIAVFDAPSEDSSCNEPETLGTTTSKNASKSCFSVSKFSITRSGLYVDCV